MIQDVKTIDRSIRDYGNEMWRLAQEARKQKELNYGEYLRSMKKTPEEKEARKAFQRPWGW